MCNPSGLRSREPFRVWACSFSESNTAAGGDGRPLTLSNLFGSACTAVWGLGPWLSLVGSYLADGSRIKLGCSPPLPSFSVDSFSALSLAFFSLSELESTGVGSDFGKAGG